MCPPGSAGREQGTHKRCPYVSDSRTPLHAGALESSLETALEEEAMAQALVSPSEDTREGMAAFAERRTPQFKGR